MGTSMRPFRLGDRVVKQLAIRTLPANILLNPSGRIEGKNMSRNGYRKETERHRRTREKEKKRGDTNQRKKETITFHR